KNMSRSKILFGLILAGVAPLLPRPARAPKEAERKPAPRLPGILFILAGDLGFGGFGCYGQTQIKTPNIDKLAAEGMRFTDCYAGCTVCAPSRCSLMTGLHTGHARIRGNAKVPLAAEDLTAAELLKGAGYSTCAIGKWGLGESGSTGAPGKK